MKIQSFFRWLVFGVDAFSLHLIWMHIWHRHKRFTSFIKFHEHSCHYCFLLFSLFLFWFSTFFYYFQKSDTNQWTHRSEIIACDSVNFSSSLNSRQCDKLHEQKSLITTWKDKERPRFEFELSKIIKNFRRDNELSSNISKNFTKIYFQFSHRQFVPMESFGESF